MEKLFTCKEVGDNKYLHRDFHQSVDIGLIYIGDKFGDIAVTQYLTQAAKNFYAPLIESIKSKGLAVLDAHIKDIYAREEASDAVITRLENGQLEVKVLYCPGVKYLKSIGHIPSKWYVQTTSTVSKVIAESTGYDFNMGKYNEDSGAVSYKFTYKQKE